MRFVLAFDSFKGCISAQEACRAAAEAIRETIPTPDKAESIECPLSDGGEGLVDCISQMIPTESILCQAHDPLMNPIEAHYVIGNVDGQQVAYMEMAATSGLPLVPSAKRNPMLTTTYGVGDMIIDATRRGCQEIVMGIGGSATCDGGRGMIQCLEEHGFQLPSNCLPHITVACDVTNPLYGPQGAAYIFAPQKGATPEQVLLLDEQLRDFARRTEAAGLAPSSLADQPGTGAAGGLGYGLVAYLHAELKSGIDIILDIRHFDSLLDAPSQTIVITGEGKSDAQTLMGKVPQGVLKRCQKRAIPVWLLSGCIDDTDHLLSNAFSLVRSINDHDPRPLDILMQPSVAKQNLATTIQQIIK